MPDLSFSGHPLNYQELRLGDDPDDNTPAQQSDLEKIPIHGVKGICEFCDSTELLCHDGRRCWKGILPPSQLPIKKSKKKRKLEKVLRPSDSASDGYS